MKQISLTFDEARSLVEQVIAEKGEGYVYPIGRYAGHAGSAASCRYFEEDGTPSCIVGHVFALKGIELQDLAYLNSWGVGHVLSRVAESYPEDVEGFLVTLQDLQDGGMAWGEAYREALRHAATEG